MGKSNDFLRESTNSARVIKESLKIGGPDPKIKEGCILEGELVVYDDNVSSPFSK